MAVAEEYVILRQDTDSIVRAFLDLRAYEHYDKVYGGVSLQRLTFIPEDGGCWIYLSVEEFDAFAQAVEAAKRYAFEHPTKY